MRPATAVMIRCRLATRTPGNTARTDMTGARLKQKGCTPRNTITCKTQGLWQFPRRNLFRFPAGRGKLKTRSLLC